MRAWRVIQIVAKVILGIVVASILFELGAYLGDVTHTGPLIVLIMVAVAILLFLRARRRRAERKLSEQSDGAAPQPGDPASGD